MRMSTLAPGEVLTSRDVHDLCRVKVKPVTVNDPWQVFDFLAYHGCWDKKYMIMSIHRGVCPKGYCKCGLMFELKYLGRYYATGHVIPAAKGTHTREVWECDMRNLKRVESAFKYMFGERMDHLLEYEKDSNSTRRRVK